MIQQGSYSPENLQIQRQSFSEYQLLKSKRWRMVITSLFSLPASGNPVIHC